MKSRPVGITVLSLLLFLNAGFYALLAVLSVIRFGALTIVLTALSPGGVGPAAPHLAMGKFLPAYYGVSTLLTGALALGFWKLQNWSRLVSLALMGISLAFLPIEFLHASQSPSGAMIGSALVRVGVTVLIGWYLLSTKVRQAFRPTEATAGPQAEFPNGSVHHAR